MIIPENTSSIQDIERGWIMSYHNVGHIKDNKASNMGFTWILKGLRNFDEYKNTQIDWVWPPKYDMQHHRMSLPLMYSTGTDSILSHSQYIFSNNGMIRVKPIVPLSDLQ